MSTLSADNRKKQEQQLASKLNKQLFSKCLPQLLGLYIDRVYAEYTRIRRKSPHRGFI